ncbi:hypothetical protein HH308_06455 [Gordonia sp. TBRC 11910]|uniref:Phage FDXHR zinc binding domain-containing protein n=1 Tax=Gordonia asplenii TaxID=2725283 RepID=A0A848KP85_9ACTN|nr:hypothetical protein [Gordonia asplenii]NMO00854.1 hypothetical protein [Gordonia asplenii]
MTSPTPTVKHIPDHAIRCPRCPAWWTGRAACHCSGCHETFTSVSGFDAHRRGSACKTPQETGLVRADRDWPGWQHPGNNPIYSAGEDQ